MKRRKLISITEHEVSFEGITNKAISKVYAVDNGRKISIVGETYIGDEKQGSFTVENNSKYTDMIKESKEKWEEV